MTGPLQGHRWRPLATAAPLAVALALFALLFSGRTDVRFSPDSREYLAFAGAIRSGELFAAPEDRAVPRALAARVPLYPALLAAARPFVDDWAEATLLLHTLLGLLTLLGVPLALRPLCPMGLSVAAVLLAFWTMRVYYPWAITEWTCLQLLLALFAASARYAQRPSPGGLSLLAGLCAAMVLTRPALVVAAAVPAAAALLLRGAPKRALLAAFTPFLAVILWMGFNLSRIDSFSLAPALGMNLFGVASIVGSAAPEPGDDPELEGLIRAINHGKRPPPGVGVSPWALGPRKLAALYNHNVHEVAEAVARSRGLDRVRYNEMLLAYSWRSLRESPWGYASWVLYGLSWLWRALPLLLPSLVLPIHWLRRGRHRGLALASLAMLGLHFLHVLLCALVEVVIPRYHNLSYFPLLAAGVIATGVLALDLRGRPAPGTP